MDRSVCAVYAFRMRKVQRSDIRKLRPAKVRMALRRRWFESRLSRVRRRSAPGLVDLGTPYGGWTVPGDLIEPSWTCYSIGAGGDISFDLALIDRFGPTVRAFEAVPDLARAAVEDGSQEPRFSAYQAAVAPSDGPVRMQVTHDTQSKSVSSAGLYESEDYVELPGRSLESLMSELGDARIDLLKLDIEGGEYDLVPSLDLQAMGVKVFATQLHHTGTVKDGRRLIESLREKGYEPVACRPAVKLTFADKEFLESRRGAARAKVAA